MFTGYVCSNCSVVSLSNSSSINPLVLLIPCANWWRDLRSSILSGFHRLSWWSCRALVSPQTAAGHERVGTALRPALWPDVLRVLLQIPTCFLLSPRKLLTFEGNLCQLLLFSMRIREEEAVQKKGCSFIKHKGCPRGVLYLEFFMYTVCEQTFVLGLFFHFDQSDHSHFFCNKRKEFSSPLSFLGLPLSSQKGVVSGCLSSNWSGYHPPTLGMVGMWP